MIFTISKECQLHKLSFLLRKLFRKSNETILMWIKTLAALHRYPFSICSLSIITFVLLYFRDDDSGCKNFTRCIRKTIFFPFHMGHIYLSPFILCHVIRYLSAEFLVIMLLFYYFYGVSWKHQFQIKCT